jgi:hypothetical protein
MGWNDLSGKELLVYGLMRTEQWFNEQYNTKKGIELFFGDKASLNLAKNSIFSTIKLC